jgi:hypothetical protein
LLPKKNRQRCREEVMRMLAPWDKKEVEKDNKKAEDLKGYVRYAMAPDFFWLALNTAEHIAGPFRENPGKRMRVVIDYDPQEPKVHVTYFSENELPEHPERNPLWAGQVPT